jgi:peptidoglycan/xylan/chitin deacetylase (PgdA/CDA1 family)
VVVLIRLMMVIVLIGAGFPASFASAQDGASELGIVVSIPELVIRSCPSPSCDGVVVVSLGETMEVTGPAEDGYFPVRVRDKTGYAWSLYVATPSTGTPVLREGTPGCNRVAFIFNLGQGDFSDAFSWNTVNYLKQESVAATMFVRAWWASYYPAWAYEFDQAGFVVGIHGEAEMSLDDQTIEQAMAMIEDTRTRLEEAVGHAVDPVFTPAEPDADPQLLSMVALAGFLPVIAGVQARDGHNSDVSVETVTANILDGVYDGAIVELHLDSPSGVNSTSLALPGVIATLREQGYTFVTIPDLARPCDDA